LSPAIWAVDLVRRHVTRGSQEIKLSPKEFDLLRHLVMHAGKVLTHRHLLREVWGPAQAEEVQYLRVFIRGLRQKLEPDPTRPTHYPDRARRRLSPSPAALRQPRADLQNGTRLSVRRFAKASLGLQPGSRRIYGILMCGR